MTEQYQWIKTNDQLLAIAANWKQAKVIALDTEFVRTDTFFAYLGLIQIGIGNDIWLIDPVDIDQWAPLCDILSDENIVKVLHSLSEDAEILHHHLGVTLKNVFDTQIAAAFLGRQVQVSYAKLVEELFDIALPKEATRSDWTKRPLEDLQCEYAAADVYWLYRIYEKLQDELAGSERLGWILEDSQRMVDNNALIPEDQYYQKLRGGWKLKSQRLLALKNLCTWREKLARTSNTNRGRILQDKDLIQIAERMPNNKSWLQKQLKLPSKKIRLYGDLILQQVRLAEDARRSDWPERIPGPLPADQSDLFKLVRAEITVIAEEHDVPAELLARRKLLEEWVRSGYRDGQYELPEAFNGWRKVFFVDSVQKMLVQQWEQLDET